MLWDAFYNASSSHSSRIFACDYGFLQKNKTWFSTSEKQNEVASSNLEEFAGNRHRNPLHYCATQGCFSVPDILCTCALQQRTTRRGKQFCTRLNQARRCSDHQLLPLYSLFNFLAPHKLQENVNAQKNSLVTEESHFYKYATLTFLLG